MQFNTIHANNFHFYEELNAVVQHEPDDFLESEVAGLLASIGIQKGKAFAPDARMKAILIDAAAAANAASRAMTFASRDPLTKVYPDRHWTTTFTHLNHEFADDGARYLDARTMSLYYSTGVTPAMTAPEARPGRGPTVYHRPRFEGPITLTAAKNYKVTLPAPACLPPGSGRSTVYDNQHSFDSWRLTR